MSVLGKPLMTYLSGIDDRPGNNIEILILSFLSRTRMSGVVKENEAMCLICEMTGVDRST